MAKLFPPLVNGIIPAFYEEDGTVKITVPFSLNRAVSKSQIKGIVLKIKTVQSSSYLYTIEQKNELYFDLENTPSAVFYLTDYSKLKLSQFYKLQIAFIDATGEIGYYSTVGVSKYTSKPSLTINNFTSGIVNTHTLKYVGIYNQQNGDITEKVYSYRFDICDTSGKIVYTSGEQLHNNSNDTESYTSYDIYELNYDLPIDVVYRIKYTITTINGLEVSTPNYRIAQKSLLAPEIKATLEVSLNEDNGYIDVNLVGIKDDNGLETLTTGAFLLSRASEDSNYSAWGELSRFKLIAQTPSRLLWRDFTVEQGKNYKYSLQQYNENNLYSDRLLSDIIYSNFEDAFLYDGEKQLRIKYNPKVSSFKVDVLEAKADTIGSQYPFITRNGRAYYKEFPISGLISYYMDSDGLFLPAQEENTTELTSDNISRERSFKMAVYGWLTNGNTKLFRSPGEGNYIVRLMNVSMTPNDTVGRMLHTFSGTAYEVADFTYDNLNSYGFIENQGSETSRVNWETILFTEKDQKTGEYKYKVGEKLNRYPAITARFNDMLPGDKVKIVFSKGGEQIIQIGATGSYHIDLGVEITRIELDVNNSMNGSMTYSYYLAQNDTFDKIANVLVREVPARQFIGEHDIIKEITCVRDEEGNWVKNPKIEIASFLDITAQKRTVKNLIEKNGKYYQDKDGKIELDTKKIDPFTLFQVGAWVEGEGYSPLRKNYTFKSEYYIDFANNSIKYQDNVFQPILQLDEGQISVEDTRDFGIHKPGVYQSLKSFNGITVNVAYQVREIEYSIEDTDTYVDLPASWMAYQKALENYNNIINDLNEDEISEIDEIETCRAEIEKTYTKYILDLVKAQEMEKEAEGK